MHFLFSSIMIDEAYPERTLRNLARFVIDMAQILEFVDPLGAHRMVKCVFRGAGLLHSTYLVAYLEWAKTRESDSGEEEIEAKYWRMLMLAWNREEKDYDELHWDRRSTKPAAHRTRVSGF